jgi:hypothetical protein
MRQVWTGVALLVWGAGEVLAASPADPATRVPAVRYDPVTSGTKSYRPVEPLPWGDVNRRVAPPGTSVPSEAGEMGKPQPPPSPAPEHGQH